MDYMDEDIQFDSLEDLTNFIKECHKEYISRERNVEDDCRFIVSVNYQITRGILKLLEDKKQSMVYAV